MMHCRKKINAPHTVETQFITSTQRLSTKILYEIRNVRRNELRLRKIVDKELIVEIRDVRRNELRLYDKKYPINK